MKKHGLVSLIVMIVILFSFNQNVSANTAYVSEPKEVIVIGSNVYIKNETNSLFRLFPDGSIKKQLGGIDHILRNGYFSKKNYIVDVNGRVEYQSNIKTTETITGYNSNNQILYSDGELYEFQSNGNQVKFADNVKDFLTERWGTLHYIMTTENDLYHIDGTFLMGNVVDINYSGELLRILTDNNELWIGTSAYISKELSLHLENVKKFERETSLGGYLTLNNELYMWGNGYNGGIGNDQSHGTIELEDAFMTLSDVKDFSIGSDVVAAIRNDGSVWMWGNGINTPKKIFSSKLPSYNVPGGKYKNASDWALSTLIEADKYYLLKSVGSKSYNQKITREEFASLVIGYYDYLTSDYTKKFENPFTDTKNSDVIKAYNLGIINGKSKNQFKPNDLVTREEMSLMLDRALKVARPNYKHDYMYKRFEDENKISSWAIDSVKKMRSMEIAMGDNNNNFNPKRNATIEEAVALTYRMLIITD